MEYSKAKSKSVRDKTYPCFKPFLLGNMTDKCLPTRALLRFHSDTFFLALLVFGDKNLMRILYNYYITESRGFLSSVIN